MVQPASLQFTPCIESSCDLVGELLDAAGLLFGRERELVTLVASLAREIDGALLWQGTHSELANELGVTPRHIRRLCAKLRTLNLPWLACESAGNAGHVWTIKIGDFVSNRARTQVGHRADLDRTQVGHGADAGRTQVGHSSGGMEPATHAGVTTKPPSEATPLQSASLPASEPACDDHEEFSGLSNLAQWVRMEIKTAGWMPPQDYILTVIEQQLRTALDSEDKIKLFVKTRLSDLLRRKAQGKQVGAGVVELALREDCHGWKSPEEQRKGERPSLTNLASKSSRPGTTVYTSEMANAFDAYGI